jgi:hypothetical protein
MSIKDVLIFIVVVGIAIWLIHIAPFIPEPWKTYGKWFIAIIAVIWALNHFGIFDSMDKIRV